MSKIYEVKELTASLKNVLETGFPFVWVQGQLSNLSRPSSGHLYFSLKDENASIAAVWFKGSQHESESFDPLTGEIFEGGPKPGLAAALSNGMEVICAGRITVYPPRGSYQIVVEIMQEAGKGRLQLEFEQLKAELALKGYFDPARKRPLPENPCRAAVVTSEGGAAIHDFLRIASGRGLAAEIRIHPTPVQGDEAPPRIAAALRAASDEGWAEVIVLIRGGGSLEDLWAFNTRAVAEAVFSSKIPVLSGVGHEVDFTLSDHVADLRAATPSHAAQLLWPERRELAQLVDEFELSVREAVSLRLTRAETALAGQEKVLRLLSPQGRLERAEAALGEFLRGLSRALPQKLEQAGLRLEASKQAMLRAMPQRLEHADHRLELFRQRLAGLDPEQPLRRGYAFVKRTDGSILRSRSDALPGDRLDLYLVDGTVPVVVSDADQIK